MIFHLRIFSGSVKYMMFGMPRVVYFTDFHVISFCFSLPWIMSSGRNVGALLYAPLEEVSVCPGRAACTDGVHLWRER